MKTFVTTLLVVSIATMASPQSLIGYVQPVSGTASSTTPSAKKHSEAGSEQNANTIPAVGTPFGMTQWTAQTRTTEVKCQPPYYYKDSLLSGFRGTHWISGSCMQDYGSLTVVPVTGKLKTLAKDYSLPFSHANETTTPAYYKVDLPAAHLTVEMSATARCGIMRFTLQRDDSLYLLVIPNSDRGEGVVQMNAGLGEVWGRNPAHRIYQGWGEPAGFDGYFFIHLEKPVRHGVFNATQVFDGDSIGHRENAGAFAGFYLRKGESVSICIGTSFSSVDGARRNLEREIGRKGFDSVVAGAKKIWEKALSQIKVEGENEKDKRVFYTALYHAFQHPRLFNDVDGTYPMFSRGYERTKKGGRQLLR